MSTLRSAFYALGFLALAGIFAVWAVGGLRSPALAAAPLLFVSDTNANGITVFSLPGLTVNGTITGLSQPQGLCSTPTGNIWATNAGTKQILEYSRTGTLIETLSDPTGDPFSCSVDELAVGNITNASGPGETYVYQGYSHGPSYDLSGLNYVDGVGFDPGNLFIVGRTLKGTFVLAELPAGSSTIHQLRVTGGTIRHPGMIEWDAAAHYLAIGDRKCGKPITTCIYHVSISGSTGTITGKTTLKAYNGHPICDMAQGTIYESGSVTYLAGGDDESSCGYATTSVNLWAFPNGDTPKKSNHSIPFSHPFGTAISK